MVEVNSRLFKVAKGERQEIKLAIRALELLAESNIPQKQYPKLLGCGDVKVGAKRLMALKYGSVDIQSLIMIATAIKKPIDITIEPI